MSRNYRLGFKVGKGLTLDEALDDLGKLAEGVNTLRVVHAKSKELGVYMPLVDGLQRVLFGGENIGDVIHGLMTADQRADVEFAEPGQWGGA